MKLTTGSSPHIRDKSHPGRIMGDVILALLPALGVGLWRFGLRSLLVTAVTILAAVAAEWLCRVGKTVSDGSALLTGLLLAMTLPHTVPLWLAAAGGAFAVALAKLSCGGLGQNVFNPALAARAMMVLAFPASMVRYETVDAVTSATPLHHMALHDLPEESVWELFLGLCSGSIGELSALALLAGGAYLVWRRVVDPRIPLAYLGAVAVLTLLFARTDAPVLWMLSQLFSGGLMLGAIFMATDYATSPVTPKGRILYGALCGALTVLFRYVGIFPEGVTYAILLMNALSWAIDRCTMPRRFGTEKGAKA